MAGRRVGGLDDPLWTVVPGEEPQEPKARNPASGPVVGAAALAGLILLTVGWFLPQPGGSLVEPTVVVVGVGIVVAIVGSMIVRSPSGALFTVIVLGLTVLAGIWTFELALPARVDWISNASQEAHTALQEAALRPQTRSGGPVTPCRRETQGTVGPLDAPYQICVYRLGPTQVVTFSKSNTTSGITYFDGIAGPQYFLDECYRHLAGPWWMFRQSLGGTGSCPFGYRYHGGP
jgi:hypothetical protein